jgi:hypothetical protein
MIYLEETLNLDPPSPETLDTFVALAQESLPALERMGFRLAAAWYNDIESFCQVTQVLEFENMAAFEESRARSQHAEPWLAYAARVEELAPRRRTRLLEPLGPIPAERLHDAWKETAEAPLGTYSIAIMEIAPGRMQQLIAGMQAVAANLPMVATWRTIVANQNEVTDVWKGPVRLGGYKRSDERTNAFFRAVRQNAPVERMFPVFTLPYSPLR